MIVEIKIENKITTVRLLKGESVLDEIAITEEHRLSEDLLPAIDGLLGKNRLSTGDVDEMVLKSDLGENFTTYRIASAVVNAFNWAVKSTKNS